MSIRIHPIKAFNDNYIWTLINDGNKQAIVIDPGQAQPVIDYLDSHDLELTSIWTTHHHHDHTGGVAELQESYPMTHVVAHSDHTVDQDQTIKDGSTVSAWGCAAQVWDVSGHTASHMAYILDIDGNKHCFCGDTLFSAGCGRVFTGTIEQLHDSFKRLNGLSSQTLLYPAHEYTANNLRFGLSIEPDNEAMQQALIRAEEKNAHGTPTLPVTLEHERMVNVFLRMQEPSVIEGVKAKKNIEDDKSLTVFAALRELKDNF
ncbi:hydroxyacylglutathione hydrolase [Psychrobacter sp.]|uniref:hydroxyacylglutathione hydrolase n=1 Tax=Psychrobacter sp. TaxID=56811 RepID=UPI0026487F6C|nr:hydroxyacylglutathione hydrolase [Psychrobacter sp.]MDN6276745.1 hydroxyacylglutathione hydrolase [Psychrobacter sp.]MDN6307885.1 hydroxyacylglutathione hydrolase [Psychrobacter sp.]